MEANEETRLLQEELDELKEAFKKLSEKQKAHYTETMLQLRELEEKSKTPTQQTLSDEDLYELAKEAVVEMQVASTSFIQRILGIGYVRATSLMDLLEQNGVIGKPDKHTLRRKVLIQEVEA